MADGFTATVDSKALLALFDQVGKYSSEFFVKRAAQETAQIIMQGARSRLGGARIPTGATSRQLATAALTAAGVGVAVVQGAVPKQARFTRMRKPKWSETKSAKHRPRFLEHGTKYMHARPFLDVTVAAEQTAYYNRLVAALHRALEVRA
jgi:HK97 gp10 family phage protein